MIGWLAVLAAASEPTTLQRIHELEWTRAGALNLASQIPGGDVETRSEAARALGRLRSADALVVLEGLRADPHADVQVAVAEALGWTPGSSELVRAWLAELRAPGRAASSAASRRYVALVEALGQQGSGGDLPILLAALREPWPVGAAAARALGRLAVRGLAVDEAVPALVTRMRAPDPRLVADAAWALRQIGLDGAAPADVDAIRDRLSRGTTPEVQAMLLPTVWPALTSEERDELFLEAATDTARGLRVAVLSALRQGDVPGDVVGTFLADPDPWVRAAALGALARDASPEASEALARHARDATDPYEAAAALTALGLADDARAVDVEQPAPIRAALAALVTDRRVLARLALEDPEPSVRSAAAGALARDPEAGPAEGAALLASSDPAVREEAVRLVARGDAKQTGSTLVPHLRVEDHQAVLAAGLEALVAAVRADRQAVNPTDRYLPVILDRAAGPRARELAEELGLELPAASGEYPALGEVRRIRGARVETTEGAFVVALDPDVAPLAVSSFATLAEEGSYDGLVFHRVEPGVAAWTSGPGWTLPDEVSSVPFDEGSVGHAGGQWFVVTGDQPQLAGQQTRFGEVVQGMHVVKRLVPGSRILSIEIERVDR